MHHLLDGFRSGFIHKDRSFIAVTHHGAPGAAEETVHAFDALGLPRLHGVQRTHEHFVQTKAIGTVVADDVIRVHDVLEGLTHLRHDLLEFDVSSLLEELSVLFFDFVGGDLGASGILVSEGENHALVEELLERFVGRDEAEVKEHLVPEAAVEQVKHGVFGTTHIEVDRHPVLFKFLCNKCVAVASVDVAEVIPARASPLRHGVRFADTLAAVLVDDLEPFGSVGERGLSAVTRLVVLEFRQQHRQFRIIDGRDFAVFPVDNRERFAPVALAAEEPVAELVVHGGLADLVGFEPFDDLRDALLLVEAVQAKRVVLAVDVGAVGSPASFTGEDLRANVFGAACIRFHDADNRQVKLLREIEVAGIVGRHGHDGASAVAGQNVVGDPHRNLGAGERVHGVATGEHAGLFLGEFGTVEVALQGGCVHVFFHGSLLFGSREFRDHRMFRGDDHVGGTEQRIATGGIDAELLFGRLAFSIGDGKVHFGTVALADPVLLHVLHALRPVELVEALQQAVAIQRDAHEPLLEVTAFHFLGAALFVAAIVQDFFVRANNLAVLAPPHLSVGVVSEALRILVFADFSNTLGFDIGRNREFFDGAALLLVFIEPGAVKALENPLRPLVILRVGGVDFLVPVVRETEALDLAAEIVTVLLGGNGRVRTGLDGVLFGREAESVPTHRVQHIETAAALVAADDVCCGVAFGVAHMETCATRVREHVQAVILGLGLIGARLESLMFFPVGLPLGFDLLRIILCHDLCP